MNGLEIAEAYFDEYGLPMLEEKFPELLPHVAAGLFGSGSECFGFDDDPWYKLDQFRYISSLHP